MKTTSNTLRQTSLATTVAGEDIVCGDYVAILRQTFEVPSYLWDSCGNGTPPGQPVQLTLIPCDAGTPLKVVAACLPFVYVRAPGGMIETLDTRRMQLVRLDRDCAKRVWKEMKKSPSQCL